MRDKERRSDPVVAKYSTPLHLRAKINGKADKDEVDKKADKDVTETKFEFVNKELAYVDNSVKELSGKLDRVCDGWNRRVIGALVTAILLIISVGGGVVWAFGKLDFSVNDTSNKITNVQESVDGLKTRMDNVEGSVDGLKMRMGNVEDSVDALKTRVGHLEGAVNTIPGVKKVDLGVASIFEDHASK